MLKYRQWSHRQVVKTQPSQGWLAGSIPAGTTILKYFTLFIRVIFLLEVQFCIAIVSKMKLYYNYSRNLLWKNVSYNQLLRKAVNT